MNIKSVLRTYSALRQMSPDDIALLETLRALNEGDRELMVETLQGKATGKKAGKKSASKSPRASGMAVQLKSRVNEQREAATKDITGESEERCTHSLSYGVCGRLPDHNIHHLETHPHHHPFVSVSDASTATTTSSSPATTTKDDSYGVNSAVGEVNAQAATGGSSGD